jgi:carboxylesterase
MRPDAGAVCSGMPSTLSAARLAFTLVAACAVSLVSSGGCSCGPQFEDTWMDSPETQDPALSDPSYLASNRAIPDDQLAEPVLLAVHGFSASTFEFGELHTRLQDEPGIHLSRVLMGGHGRDVETWRATTPDDWFEPVLDELDALAARGHTNVSIVTSSTAGTLLLRALARGDFDDRAAPREILMVDPLIEPLDQNLYALPAALWIDHVYYEEFTDEERRHWYSNRPREVLLGLLDVIEETKAALDETITLPAGTNLKLYISETDEAVDPRSPGLIEDGVEASGGTMEREDYDARFHVFVRGAARASFTGDDTALQQQAFDDMIARLSP